jgi:hypothetical protein
MGNQSGRRPARPSTEEESDVTELYEESRDLDRRLNAATDPAEMRRLITRRKLNRAGLEFETALRQYERANPLPVVVDRLVVIR